MKALRCEIGEFERHVTARIGVVELRPGEQIAEFVKTANVSADADQTRRAHCEVA